MKRKLFGAGFVRVDLVDSPGQFALRGGIVDIYSPFGTFADSDGDTKSGAYALRIELFGDDIDRMGLFEPDTQRMTQSVLAAELQPARELLCDKPALERLKKLIAAQFRATKNEDAMEELVRETTAVDAALRGEGDVPFLDKYITAVYEEKTCLLDYFTGRRLVVERSTNALRDRLQAFEWHMNQTVTELVEGGTVAGKYAEYNRPASYLEQVTDAHVTLHLDSIAYSVSDRRLAGLFGFRTRQTVSYAENDELFRDDLRAYSDGSYRRWCLPKTTCRRGSWRRNCAPTATRSSITPRTWRKCPAGA